MANKQEIKKETQQFNSNSKNTNIFSSSSRRATMSKNQKSKTLNSRNESNGSWIQSSSTTSGHCCVVASPSHEKIDHTQQQQSSKTKTSSLSNLEFIRIGSSFKIKNSFWSLLFLILLSLDLVNALPSSTSNSNRHHYHLSKFVNGNGNAKSRRDQVSFMVDGRWNGLEDDDNFGEIKDGVGKGKGKGKEKAKEMENENENESNQENGIAGNSSKSSSNQFHQFASSSSSSSSSSASSSSSPSSSSSNGQVEERPTKRWGHTSSFLNGTISSEKSQLLFIGGQVDKQGQITNDVWSLDISDLTNNSSSFNSSSNFNSNSNQWSRLSSLNLPPNAFSSSVLLAKTKEEKEDQIWLIGGLTMDCMKDSPVYVWKNSTGWSSPQIIQETPLRRKGSVALIVPKNLGKKSSNSTNNNNNKDMEKGMEMEMEMEMNGVMVLGGISDNSTCYQPSNSSTSNSNSSSEKVESPKEVNYFGLDIWSQSSKSKSSSSSKSSSNSTLISPISRSLSLDSRMKSLSLINSATVLIPNHSSSPKNSPSHDPRVAFMGGKTLSGNLAPLDHFWVLELNSGNWERWISVGINSTSNSNSTSTSISSSKNGIPKGRIGHSTIMTSSGKIVMFGGYLNETDKIPTNELWTLDIKKNPAQWEKLDFDEKIIKARAFHTANMIGDVMIVGFGDDGIEGSLKRNDSEDQLSFLDTQDQDPKNWKWSKNVKEVLDGRNFRSSPSAQSAVNANSNSSPSNSESSTASTSNSNSNGNVASNQEGESKSGNQAGAAATESSTNSPSASSPSSNQSNSNSNSNPETHSSPATQGDNTGVEGSSSSPSNVSNPESNSSNSSPSNSESNSKTDPIASNGKGENGSSDESGSQNDQKKSGAIAGSVLGAAALLGTMGGLYAYKKRKDSQYQSSGAFDSSDPRFGFVDGGKKHDVEPVSNLWLTASRGLKRRASETSSLGNSISGLLFGKSDSKGRRGSGGSNGSSTSETLWEKNDIYTIPSQPPKVAVVSMNNLGHSSESKGLKVFRKFSTSNKINELKNKRRSISSSLIGRNGRRSPIEDSEAQLGSNSFNDRIISQGFISSIIHDDDEGRGILPNEYISPDLPKPMRSGFFNQYRNNSFPSPPIAAAMLSQPERILRAPSCESLGSSDGSASHCSYPYLSAMHRPSLANGLTSSGSEASISREDINRLQTHLNSDSENETSPREKMLRQMVKAMRNEVDNEISSTDLENGRNQIMNPFSTPQEDDNEIGLNSGDDDDDLKGIESHLNEESRLHKAHKRAMDLKNLKSPSNQTDFDSDEEEEMLASYPNQNHQKKLNKSKNVLNSPSSKIVNSTLQQQSNFQTPIFGWEPIRSPKVQMNGPYPSTSNTNTNTDTRGKRLGAALMFNSSGNKNLLQSSTADLCPRDPSSSPSSNRTPNHYSQTPLSIAAERAELLIQMDQILEDDKDFKSEQRRKSEKRARKSLLRVTNEA